MAAMLEKLMSGQRSGTRPFVVLVVSQNHSNVFLLQVLEERIDRGDPWLQTGGALRAPQASSRTSATKGTNARRERID